MKLLNNAYRSLTVIKKRSKFESYQSFLSEFPSTPLCHKGKIVIKGDYHSNGVFSTFLKLKLNLFDVPNY